MSSTYLAKERDSTYVCLNQFIVESVRGQYSTWGLYLDRMEGNQEEARPKAEAEDLADVADKRCTVLVGHRRYQLCALVTRRSSSTDAE